MTTETDLLADIADRMRGRPIPDDLRALVAIEARFGADARRSDPLYKTETHIIGPGELPDLLSHDYLSAADRADPDIMSNIAAIDEVIRHAAWIAEIMNGDLAGYWLHPDEPADRPPAIVRFDTEGQFEILRGRTFVEGVIANLTDEVDDHCDENYVSSADEQVAKYRAMFAEHGVPVGAVRAGDLRLRNVAVHPAVLHERRYNAERAERGLPPIG